MAAAAAAAAAANAAMLARSAPIPSSFSGTNTFENPPAAFRRRLDRYFAVCGITAMEMMVNFAIMLLTGPAQAWYESLENQPNYVSPTTLDDLFVLLAAQFPVQDAARRARVALNALRQGRSTVSVYYAQFLALILHVPDMSPADRCFAFLNGLRPEINAVVIQHVKFDDFESCHSHALRAENRQPVAPVAAPAHVNAIIRQPGLRLQRLTPADRARLMAEGKCFRCRQSGHQAADCTAFPRDRQQPAVAAPIVNVAPAEAAPGNEEGP